MFVSVCLRLRGVKPNWAHSEHIAAFRTQKGEVLQFDDGAENIEKASFDRPADRPLGAVGFF